MFNEIFEALGLTVEEKLYGHWKMKDFTMMGKWNMNENSEER